MTLRVSSIVDSIKKIQTDRLEIAYHDYGPADGSVVVLLHGFPYDPNAYKEVASILAADGLRCVVPYLRGYGPTRFLSPNTIRSGQQAALGADLLAFLDALSIKQATLGGYDWGGRAACIVAALWPERVSGLVSCGQGYNIQDIPNAVNPARPEEETRYWYIYYFNTKRGEQALAKKHAELCLFIWKLWSPSWNFDSECFAATSASFDNPDFADVVVHSYRHRLGECEGDPSYDEIENRLALQPNINVPTIVLQGADDSVDPPDVNDCIENKFINKFERKIIDSVGHNLPQENPAEFADAVLRLARSK